MPKALFRMKLHLFYRLNYFAVFFGGEGGIRTHVIVIFEGFWTSPPHSPFCAHKPADSNLSLIIRMSSLILGLNVNLCPHCADKTSANFYWHSHAISFAEGFSILTFASLAFALAVLTAASNFSIRSTSAFFSRSLGMLVY